MYISYCKIIKYHNTDRISQRTSTCRLHVFRLKPVPRDRVSIPLKLFPRRLYYDTYSPREDLFQNRFAPRRLYSKTMSPEERGYFILRRNKLSLGGVFISTGVRL